MESLALAEIEQYEHVDTLYLIDMDRCLLNTRKAQRVLEAVIEAYGHDEIDTDDLRRARELEEASGGTFDTLGYLKSKMKAGLLEERERELDEIVQKFIEVGLQHDLLEPGAKELLEFLGVNELPFVLWTSGDRPWQSAKISAGDLEDNEYTVLATKHKGPLLVSMYDADRDAYVIPRSRHSKGYIARRVVTVDDKDMSYMETSQHSATITNYHVLPEDESHQVPSQTIIGPHPENMKQVRGLHRLVAILGHSIVDKK